MWHCKLKEEHAAKQQWNLRTLGVLCTISDKIKLQHKIIKDGYYTVHSVLK